MKLNDILNEKIGSFVFVKEPVAALSRLLSTNRLQLDKHPAGEKNYYVLKTASNRKALITPEDKYVALIQLNGDKLNAHVKQKNVKLYLNDRNNKMGDNLYTDEEYIKNATDFIEQISILIADKDIVPVSNLKEIETICKEKNIPLYFYNNKNDFVNNNRHKKYTLGKPDYNYKRQNYAGIPQYAKAFIFFSKKDDLGQIPEKYARFLNEFIMEQHRAGFVKRLREELKTLKDNPLAFEEIKGIFSKAGTDNVESIVKTLADKWKSIINKRQEK